MYWDGHRSEYMTPNRMLNPRTGRWTQPDPFWGIHNMQRSRSAIAQSGNLFMFVMHNPVRWVDPTGLFASDGFADWVRELGQQGGSGQTNTPSSAPNGSSTGSLIETIRNVSRITSPRVIVNLVASGGVHDKVRDMQHAEEPGGPPPPRGDGGGGSVRGICAAIAGYVAIMGNAAWGVLSRASEFGIKTYWQLSRALRHTGLEAHHIIEHRFRYVEGLSTRIVNRYAVALTPAEHQVFTNLWRSHIPYGTSRSVDIARIWEVAQEIYANYPALLEAARIALGQ